MSEARKNGTKPQIAPFRLPTKPSIKDAPIFEDIAFTPKKRPAKRLSTSWSTGGKDLQGTEQVTSFGKTKSPRGFAKIYGDPLKYNVADPFSIMTAEPDEEEEDLTVEPEVETAEDEFAESCEQEIAESCEPETAIAVNEDSNQSAIYEFAEIESTGSAKNESFWLASVNDIQGALLQQDMLEVNADIDSSTLRDTDDNVFEDNLMKQKDDKEHDKREKRHKKHKKSEKREKSERNEMLEKHGEKKKKRRKERNRSEDDSQDKRHKKDRRENRSSSRNRSRSRSSSKRHRRNRSEERSVDKSRRDSSKRDSARFGSHTSRSRSPVRRDRSHGHSRISISPKQKTFEQSPTRRRSSREKSPRRLSKGGKSASPELSRSKDRLERKSREERSEIRSPVESKQNKSDSYAFASTSSPGKNEMNDVEVKKSDTVSQNVYKSPSNGPQLKSYVNVVPKDVKPLVPYDDDMMSISPRDSVDGLNFTSEKETPDVPEAEQQKSHKGKESKNRESGEGESGKKVKDKKKSKKKQEKKRKQKALAKSEATEDARRNTDDELEDLLFTKTNKESKEDVFNDSDVFTAKHNLRSAVVDIDRKKLLSMGSPGRDKDKLSPMRKETLEKKKAGAVRREPLKSKKHPKDCPKRERFSEISEMDVFASETLHERSGPVERPAQGGFSTIPFLSVDEEKTDDIDQLFEERIQSELYSPLGQSFESNYVSYSPMEGPISDFGSPKKSSTMNLSDISTKDNAVQDTLGIVTTAEKVEDFLVRIQPPEREFNVVDMEMSSPTNGIKANSDNDDDIIEQLHKEFVRTQHEEDVQPSTYMDNYVPISSALQIPQYPTNATNAPSSFHTAASDPIVRAYGLNKKYSGIPKKNRPKRSKQKKIKSDKKGNEPFDKEKKDIEDALNRVHRQARVEDEMKHALKVYFKRKDITKEEYKMILRKGVPQVANSNHTIDPERIRSLVKKYVAKFKGSRERREQTHFSEQQEIPFTFSP